MMYIIRQSDGLFHSNEKPEYTWSVGSRKPRHKDGNPFDDVCEVYADGPELENVRQRCTNIPDVPSSGSMVWKPPFAQFIYDSLILHEPVVNGRAIPKPR